MIYNESKYNKDWNENKLSDLGVFSRGKSKHRPRNDEKLFAGGKYPFIQTGDIKEANLYIKNHTQEYGEFGLKQSKLWNKGTLCITIAANIAETAILSYPACFPDSVVGFNAYESQSSEIFMYYVFEYIKASIQNAASGSIQDNINIDYLMTLNFKIPEKNYQDMIVALLGAIDKKIISNNDINDNLEQQMHLIFEDMMAKATNNKIKGEFIVAKNLTQVITGKEDANFSVSNGKYRFFTCSNTPLRCDEYAFNSSSVLIAGNGDFNVKHYSGKFNAYQRTYVLSPPKEYYALLYLAALYRINSFKTGSSGSIVKFITKNDVENIPVFMTHDSKYLDELNKLVIMQEQNILENELLVQLRDWLLPMLMNGQATISD